MDPAASLPSLEAIRAGDKRAVARALAAIEAEDRAAAVLALLDGAAGAAKGHTIGLTGPPGVGKSSLVAVLISALRERGRTVAVIAVDPSSKRTGGALLGDRTRIKTDPDDAGIFIRSMAARDRLGGLASLTFPSLVILRAAFDVVLVETVGVGQSETDIRNIADTVVFCIQPGSGDSLQFMKAGIMEVPDIALVTKADMGAPARRAVADVSGALSLTAEGGHNTDVLSLSSTTGEGVSALIDALDAHVTNLRSTTAFELARSRQLQLWVEQSLRERFGTEGLARVRRSIQSLEGTTPFSDADRLAQGLLRRLEGADS